MESARIPRSTRPPLPGPGPRIFIASLCLWAVGCTEAYWSETIISPDGKIQRAIYQPADKTPEAARPPKQWEQITYASEPDVLDSRGWRSSLFQFPAREKSAAASYLVAQGRFNTVEDLPEHILMQPLEGSTVPGGTLKRDYARIDYGFLVEHRWTETLTDCVTFDDMKQARKELLDLLLDLETHVFDTILGAEYDASGIAAWLKTEGSGWLAEITDLMFLQAAAHQETASKEVDEEIAAVCERHGLRLKHEGRLLKDKALQDAFEKFAAGVIVKGVRHRDGRPLNQKEVQAVVDGIKNLSVKSPDGARPQGEEQFDAAHKKVIAQRFGGEEKFERRLNTLLNRVFGLYLVQLFGAPKFESKLTLPGTIVDTNGQILSPNRAQWSFDATEAYPFGYAMRAHSLDPDREVQKLLQGDPLGSLENMLHFVDLVDDHEPLIEALRECRGRASLKPLRDYQERVALGPNALENLARLNGVLNLLRIPAKP